MTEEENNEEVENNETDLAPVEGTVDEYSKEIIKDKINEAFKNSKGFEGMSVPEVVAQAFLVLMTKGRAGTLDKSEALELKVIDSMSNILGWNDKEKKVIHTLDIPKINAKDI